jgi:hypothetical protein
METPTSARTGDERSSWGETLAAIVPFLFLGPVTAALRWGHDMGYLPTVILGWGSTDGRHFLGVAGGAGGGTGASELSSSARRIRVGRIACSFFGGGDQMLS